jgi:hypothetical protein
MAEHGIELQFLQREKKEGWNFALGYQTYSIVFWDAEGCIFVDFLPKVKP